MDSKFEGAPGEADARVCCLGEGGLQTGVCEWHGNYLRIKADHNNTSTLASEAYLSLGLRDSVGSHKDQNNDSLSSLNDHSKTWPEIADLLESDPENWFTHSV